MHAMTVETFGGASHAWWSALGDVIPDASNIGSTLNSTVLPPVARIEGILKSARLKRECRLRRLRMTRWMQRARGRAMRRNAVTEARLKSTVKKRGKEHPRS